MPINKYPLITHQTTTTTTTYASQVVGLLKIFKEMDTNGDGVLTLAELREALSGKGLKIGETTAKVGF